MSALCITGSPCRRYIFEEGRIGYIDAAKGFGIFLIVLGHVTRYEPLVGFLYSFHVPVFFIVSGAFFKSVPFADFVRKKLRTLVIPYFVFAALSTLYWLIIERRFRDGSVSPLSVVANVFFMSGGPDVYAQNAALWFLPALFVAEILFYWMDAAAKYNPGARFAFPVVTYLLGMIVAGAVNHIGIRLPFMADVALLAMAWYSLGFCLNPLLLRFLPQKRGRASRIAWLVACWMFGVAPWLLVDLAGVSVNYGDLVFSDSIMPAVTGTIGFCFVLFMSIALEEGAVRDLGRRSLGVMCAHEPIKRVVIKLAETTTRLTGTFLRDGVLVPLVLAVITITCACTVTVALERFAPWALGGGRSRRGLLRIRTGQDEE